MNLYEKYAQVVYDNACDKGFWEGPQNRGERCMLIISELGECLEAHRNANFAILRHDWLFTDSLESQFSRVFKALIKNTVEDEIADVYIRILDYTKGFNESVITRDYRKVSTGNFADDLLTLTMLTLKAHNRQPGCDWGYVLAAIETFCSWYNIDLERHIQWKMRYNSTRPRLHGKQY